MIYLIILNNKAYLINYENITKLKITNSVEKFRVLQFGK